MNHSKTIGLVGITKNQQEARIALQGVQASMNLFNGSLQVQIEQRYVNLETIPIEAVYNFPLPLEASVCGFRVKIGQREMEAKLEEREAAFEKYDEAIAEGKTAYLLDADTPNHFTCSVGNLAPGEDVTVILSYVQMLGLKDGIYRLSLPTLLACVYTPDDVAEAMDPAELDRLYPPRSLDPLPYGLQLNATINLTGGIKTIDCPSHTIKTTWESDSADISFSSKTVAMDRDFILNITPKTLPVNLSYCCPDPYAKGWIAYAQFLPSYMANPIGPQNITFMLDCSGSMASESISQAKSALQLLLASLQPKDLFNIVAFGSSYTFFSQTLLEYNDDNLSRARAWVRDRDADMGGTEVLRALRKALEYAGNKEQSIILLTDGYVGNTGQIITAVKQTNTLTRIYTIGLGYGTDEELLYSLASETGGAVEMAYPGESLEPIVSRHLSRIRCAKVESLSLLWGNTEEQLTASDYVFIPGESKWFMKHLGARPEAPIQLKVGFEDDTELLLQSDAINDVSSEFSFLPQLYAKYMLQKKGKATQGSLQTRKSDISMALKLSLQYGVLCPETSFVLVDPLTRQTKRSRIGLRKVPLGVHYHTMNSLAVDNNLCSRNILFQVAHSNKSQSHDVSYMRSMAPPPSILGEKIVLSQTAQGCWNDPSLLHDLQVDEYEFRALVSNLMKIYQLANDVALSAAMSLLVWFHLNYRDIGHRNEHTHIIAKAEQWLTGLGIDYRTLLPRLHSLLPDQTG